MIFWIYALQTLFACRVISEDIWPIPAKLLSITSSSALSSLKYCVKFSYRRCREKSLICIWQQNNTSFVVVCFGYVISSVKLLVRCGTIDLQERRRGIIDGKFNRICFFFFTWLCCIVQIERYKLRFWKKSWKHNNFFLRFSHGETWNRVI